MKLARDIMSLSTFKRDSNKVMRQMKKTKQPVVLTVNGKAAVVVQDAESYQKLLELKERSEVVEILRHRLASRSRKKGRPAEDFFNEFFARRITFQSKIDEKVQSRPPFRCRVGHRIILQMGLSSVGRRKRETVGAETTARH